jgi:signal transduction histidine kinase
MNLLEVFTAFSDNGGNLLTLETYVAVSVRATEWDAARRQLPLVALAVLIASAAASPFTVAATRRSRRLAAARNAVLSLAAAAADQQRRDLARMLHDGPIQSLAAAHVALSAIGLTPSVAVHYPIATIGQMVQAGIAELRGLTSDLMPPHPPAQNLAEDLPRILHREVPRAIALEIQLPAAPTPEITGPYLAFIVQAATELVRNAVRHGRPGQISVTVTAGGGSIALTVSDDGSGFDPGRPAAEGHLGLVLLRHAVASASGTLTVSSGPAGGCTAILRLPVT